jgi:hypothetical protein
MATPVTVEVLHHRRTGLGRFESVVVRLTSARSFRSVGVGVDVLRKREHLLLGQGSHTISDVRPGTREATVLVPLQSRSWASARADAYITMML